MTTTTKDTIITPLIACFGAVLATATCGTFETADGTGGGTDAPEPLAGHTVKCCYVFSWDSASGVGEGTYCAYLNNLECIDPQQWDHEDADDRRDFCDQKCSDTYYNTPETKKTWFPSGFQFVGDPQEEDNDANPLTDWLTSCEAVSGEVIEQNICTPLVSGPIKFDTNLHVPPTHEGEFTSTSTGQTLDLEIESTSVSPNYEMYVSYALDQCDEDGIDGGTCRLVLTEFDLSITSTFTAGDYNILSSNLRLAQPRAAEVSFSACVRGSCVGTFEFSQTESNALAMDLTWQQQRPSFPGGPSNPVDDGWLHLGNDGNALGGVNALSGVLTLDDTASSGTLRLVGEGSDSFGGEFASIDFDVTGDTYVLVW